MGGATVQSWQSRSQLFGNVALLAFLLMQCLDGVLTYVGVVTFGHGVEANPLLAELMVTLGAGAALTTAKTLAAGLGILLHLREVHGVVMLLAALYLVAAVGPWTAILFF